MKKMPLVRLTKSVPKVQNRSSITDALLKTIGQTHLYIFSGCYISNTFVFYSKHFLSFIIHFQITDDLTSAIWVNLNHDLVVGQHYSR